ncbi:MULTISPECIES: hypothetical protein [unclassified Helicobacter]|uniref:hypothetical protein n=1 Tax=unclassified Helicobacter TaxID=2593540 RepID=UPI000CF19ABE|nr:MULTISPECIES: hypothetical protein [unclassified Helicobacter]
MKLKYYIASVVLIVLVVGICAYNFLPKEFLVSISMQDGKVFTVPLIVLLGIFAGILFLLGLLFFAIDWVVSRISVFYQQKDLQQLILQILDQACRDNYTPISYRDRNFLTLSKILKRFSLTPKLDSQNSGINKVDRIFEVFNQVELGYEQDLKKYHLSLDNSFYIKNILNRLKKDYRLGFSILADGDYSEEVKEKVFLSILNRCNQKEITKILENTTYLSKTMLFEAVEAYKKLQFMIDDKMMVQFCKKANFEASDYIWLTKKLKGFFGPDEWLKFFENLTLLEEKAELSFLYILCDLEMISQVEQRLSNIQKDDFLAVRAFIDLRKQGKGYPLDLFFL